MTTLLTTAFGKAAVLPENLQDELARELIEEIEWEQRWNSSLAKSAGQIDQMARLAIQEFEAGKTKEQGFDGL